MPGGIVHWLGRASLWAPLLLLLAAAQCPAWTPRRPILHGAALRPFPALFQIDYPLARARAWLAAISMAAKRLPPNLQWPRGSAALARLAAAGLIFPVDVVTPRTAGSREIRVFLKDDNDGNWQHDSWMRDPTPFLLRMCLVWETETGVRELMAVWPQNLEEAGARREELENLGSRLNQLWQAWQEGAGALPDDSGSAAILLAKALEKPGTPQSARLANQAAALFLEREVAGDGNAGLWTRLAAQALYLRALGEQRQGSAALAEADYGGVIARLTRAGDAGALLQAALDARAALRRRNGNIAGMCVDYRAACGLGQCQGLAASRRAGHCREQEP